LPEGLDPIPDDVLLDPNWLLDFVDSTHPEPQNGTFTLASHPVSDDDLPPPDLLPIPNSLAATITSNARITPKTHWQDVRHLKLSTPSSHPYVPGSTLTIYPKNFPIDVNEFLNIMNWTPIADVPLHFIPTNSSSTSGTLPIPHFKSTNTTITLRNLLTSHLDILSIPRRSFFAHLAHYTSDPFQRDRLLEFTDPQYIDELYDYTTRPRRSILEVLQEFETVKVPWQRVCSLIPVMRGRQFSIASADQGKGEVELLIAIVKYKTVIKRIRQGVCTRYISSLAPGAQISVTLQKGGLGVTQKEIERPVVMVGPGTGVAPMRSLIYQRIMWREENGLVNAGKDLLFYGCRNAEADYFFKDEWTELMGKGVPLEVFAAFSRDQVCCFFQICFEEMLISSTAPKGLRARSRPTTKRARIRCFSH
jgi:sulfite reductase alpha subunit-like flavoprotein